MAAPCKYYINGKTLSKEQFLDYVKTLSQDEIANVTPLMKKKVGEFSSSHFDEKNILVHIRHNTRTDADGNKVLFLEEVQSDWGQIGKKEGFGSNEKNDYNKLASELQGEYEVDGQDIFSDVINVKQGTPIQKLNAMDRLTKYFGKERALKIVENQGQSKIPSAPFVTDTNAWTKLGLKVALKEGVRQNVKSIAWTTGEQQNERYDLSKQVDRIDVEKVEEVPNLFFVDIRLPDGTKYMLEVENGVVRSDSKYEGQRLEDIIGKDIAEKILNGGTQTLQGDGLKIGGKGMKGFYGSPSENSLGIVGNVAKSLFKQEPKTTTINTGDGNKPWYAIYNKLSGNSLGGGYTLQEAQDYIKGKEDVYEFRKVKGKGLDETTQHSIDITPELKQEAETGLPLFKDIKGRGKEIADLLRKGKIKIGGLQSNIAGIPIALYNTAIETIALALEGGANLTQAIQKAINKHKLNQQKGFNQPEFIAKLEEATGEKFTDTEQPNKVEEQDGGDKEPPSEAAKPKTLREKWEAAKKQIDEKGINDVLGLPKAKLPDGTKLSGFGEKQLGELIKKAGDAVIELVEFGMDLKEAIDAVFSDTADYLRKNGATEKVVNEYKAKFLDSFQELQLEEKPFTPQQVAAFKALEISAKRVQREALEKTGLSEDEIQQAKEINDNFENIVNQLTQNNKIEKKC